MDKYAIPADALSEISRYNEVLNTFLDEGVKIEREGELWLAYPPIPVKIGDGDDEVIGEFRLNISSKNARNEYVFWIDKAALKTFTEDEG